MLKSSCLLFLGDAPDARSAKVAQGMLDSLPPENDALTCV